MLADDKANCSVGKSPFSRKKGMEMCFLCGAWDAAPIFHKGHWHYLICRGCGLVSLHPKPTEGKLEESYSDYLPEDPDKVAEWKKTTATVVSASADMISRHFPQKSGRLLDVGCGYGFFLAEMKKRGWAVEGVEISPAGRRHTRSLTETAVYSEPIEKLHLLPESYDVVSLLYVIEHVAEPLALIGEVRRILKPGGLVILRWPHSTPIVRLLGRMSSHLDIYHTPYHIHDFSPRTMTRLLEMAGFRKVTNMVGGYTKPSGLLQRIVSIISGMTAESLFTVSSGKFLLPGISKTTLAWK